MNHMNSKLYLFLVNDNINALKGIMGRLQVSDQRTPANNTVLHLACQYGSIRCLKEILRRADESLLLLSNSRGETGLHLAAREGNYSVVEALIEKASRSMVPQPNDLENTSSTVLQNLIRASNVEFETALHAAVRYNHEKVVQLLVKEDPSYLYPRNKYDETPLYLAAVRCYNGVTKVILDNCESPTYGGPHGRTALHAALMNKNGYGCMKLLLEKNKDLIKVADSNGWTAFHYVAHNNHNDLGKVVKFLMNVNKSVAYLADEKYKRTPLHVAACKGNEFVMEEFLKYVPDGWENVDGNGQNILHIAVSERNRSMINYIWSQDIKRGSLLIQRDKEGNTPLHLVAKFECYFDKICLTWDDDCEDLGVVNNTNFTPLDVLHQKQTAGTKTPEALIEVTVDRSGVGRHWDGWIMKMRVEERYGRRLTPEEDDKLNIKRYREKANTHMVVAALITTVALTAGFTMPGGFDGNQGPNQGSPVLLRKTAFKTFMVADTIALLFSISSLFLYFLTSLNITRLSAFYSLVAATVSNVISITAMMVAFIAGTSAVLSHSSALTLTVSIISSLFIFLVLYMTFRACWVGFGLGYKKSRLLNIFLAMVGLRKVFEGLISYNNTQHS